MAGLKLGINDMYSFCQKNNMMNLLNEWDYQANLKTPHDYTYQSHQDVF